MKGMSGRGANANYVEQFVTKVMTGMDVSVAAAKRPDINGLTGSVRSAEKSAIIRIGKWFMRRTMERWTTTLQADQ